MLLVLEQRQLQVLYAVWSKYDASSMYSLCINAVFTCFVPIAFCNGNYMFAIFVRITEGELGWLPYGRAFCVVGCVSIPSYNLEC